MATNQLSKQLLVRRTTLSTEDRVGTLILLTHGRLRFVHSGDVPEVHMHALHRPLLPRIDRKHNPTTSAVLAGCRIYEPLMDTPETLFVSMLFACARPFELLSLRAMALYRGMVRTEVGRANKGSY